MAESTIKIRNARVIVTQNEKREILRDCDVLIEGNKITKVGKGIKEREEFEIDGKNKLLMPGLVNAHTHAAMTLLRSYADDMELNEWLTTKIWPREAKLTRNDIYAGTLLGAVEMIRSGTTAFMDMYFYIEESKRALEEVGLRGNLSLLMLDLKMLDLDNEQKLGTEVRNKEEELVHLNIGPHAPYSVSEDVLRRAAEFAEKNDCQIHIHVAETRKDVFDCKKKTGKTPVEYLNHIGFLSNRVVAAHCVWLTKSEARLLGKNKVNVAHCPVSNMKLASGGVTPVPELVEAGANVCLGTDGAASNNSLDIVEEMKLAALLQKHARWDARILHAQQVLDFATRNGAKALRLNSGSIEEGKLADLVMLDLRAPNLTPLHNPVSLIVYAATPENVSDVIVNGKLVLENRKMKTVDEEKVLELAEKASDGLIARE